MRAYVHMQPHAVHMQPHAVHMQPHAVHMQPHALGTHALTALKKKLLKLFVKEEVAVARGELLGATRRGTLEA